MVGSSLSQTLKRRWLADREQERHRRQQTRILDIRLLPAALLVWVFTLLWILEGAGWAFLFSMAVVLFCLVAKLAERPLGSGYRIRVASMQNVLLLSLLLVCCQAVSLAARGYDDRWDFLKQADGGGVRFTGIVKESLASPGGSYATAVLSDSIQSGSGRLEQPLLLRLYTDEQVAAGEPVRGVGSLEVRGTYYRVRGGLYPHTSRQGQSIFLEGLKGRVREKTLADIGGDHTGLLLGMAYGDDSSLSKQALTDMRVAGLTHLTAVSGANITLIFVLVYRVAQSFRLKRLWLILLALVGASCYVLLVGFDGSVLRAWVMGILGALGLVLGHGAHMLTALSSCIIFLLLADPELASNYGFALSVVATASILFLAPALSRLGSHLLPGVCAELLAVPFSAALWCSPVLLLLSDAFYPYTVLANLLVAPLVAPITLLGLCQLLLAGSGLTLLTGPILQVGQLLTGGVHWLASWVSSLPHSSLALPATVWSVTASSLCIALVSLFLICCDYRLHRPVDVRSVPGRPYAQKEGES